MRPSALLGGASLALLLAAAVACDGAKKPPFLPEVSPTATAEATPTLAATPTTVPTLPASSPTPETRDFEGFRVFAAQVAQAVAAGDGQTFVDRARQSTETCAGTEELGPCARKPAGTRLEGVWWGIWRTDASELRPPDDIASDFESFVADARAGDSDTIGSGSALLYALAHARPGVFGEGQAYYAVVTGILQESGGPERRIAVYQFTFDGERWRLYAVIEAGVLFEEWLSGDCVDCYDQWERWEASD